MPGIPVSQGFKPSQYNGFVLPNMNPNLYKKRQTTILNTPNFKFGSEMRGFRLKNEKYQSRTPINLAKVFGGENSAYNEKCAWIKDLKNSNMILLASAPQIEESFSVAMYSESPVGSDGPVSGFSNMGARKLSVNFEVDQSYLPYNCTVEQYVQKFRKLIYPTYTTGGVVNPPVCSFHAININMIGICDSFSVSWGTTARRNSIDSAKISFSIVETQVSI